MLLSGMWFLNTGPRNVVQKLWRVGKGTADSTVTELQENASFFILMASGDSGPSEYQVLDYHAVNGL